MNQAKLKKQEHDELLNAWTEKYQEQIENGANFTIDGPINWDIWENTDLKILFLLKEAHGDYEPNLLPPSIGNSYSKNIARWRFALNTLYNNPSQKPKFPDNSIFENPSDSFSDIALVEVKKLNENKNISSNNEIKDYAKQDATFLKKQIEIINPQIVFCCYTDESYDIIFEDDSFTKLGSSINKCQAFKSNNKLVIDFYHPSTRNGNRDRELFDTLCELIIEGKIFSEFNWK
jgi:hypothetical protein